ncbi:MAG: hypothetical protein J0H40_04015 [Rhizobiales bacterium]|nr:hypothetical protein [Hyphomicrobiales bacterium]
MTYSEVDPEELSRCSFISYQTDIKQYVTTAYIVFKPAVLAINPCAMLRFATKLSPSVTSISISVAAQGEEGDGRNARQIASIWKNDSGEWFGSGDVGFPVEFRESK